MKALYCRVSTLDQKTDRQKASNLHYDRVIEDKCSGAIPFFDRDGGKAIKKLIKNEELKQLDVLSIDRLGRDHRDIINTIHYFTSLSIPIHFIGQGLTTLDQDGKENPISKMIISVLGIVGEMQRVQGKEAQRQGIAIAKANGTYKGRSKGTSEAVAIFLSKKKSKQALEYLKTDHNIAETAKLTGLSPITVTKVKRLGLPAETV